MKTDSIFRIASMTKPITSVAIMMLFEEGKLFLTDPVSKFIPGVQELDGDGRHRRRGEARAGAARDHDSRSARRIESGITYGFLNGGAVGGGYRKNGVTDGLTSTTMTLEENINKLAAEPLVSQPGDRFNYSLSTDVLGARRRSGVGAAVRRVPARAHLQAAEDDRHRLRRARREVVAIRDGVFAGRQGRHPADERSRNVRQHQHVAVGALQGPGGRISPAAPASHRRRATTRASRTCC